METTERIVLLSPDDVDKKFLKGNKKPKQKRSVYEFPEPYERERFGQTKATKEKIDKFILNMY